MRSEDTGDRKRQIPWCFVAAFCAFAVPAGLAASAIVRALLRLLISGDRHPLGTRLLRVLASPDAYVLGLAVLGMVWLAIRAGWFVALCARVQRLAVAFMWCLACGAYAVYLWAGAPSSSGGFENPDRAMFDLIV